MHANIVATVIASRAMTPVQAVLIVGFFEFMGPLLGGTAVANTIGTVVDLNGVDPQLAVLIMFCGLLGAIVWNLATWCLGCGFLSFVMLESGSRLNWASFRDF